MRLIHTLGLLITSLSASTRALRTLSDHHGGRKCDVLFNERVDCGYFGITREECLARGCCWRPTPSTRRGIPWCFHARNPEPAYYVDRIWSVAEGKLITLRHHALRPDRHAPPILLLNVEYQHDIVHVAIFGGNNQVAVPEFLYQAMPGYPMPKNTWSSEADGAQLNVLLKDDPFQLQVRRRGSHHWLFNTEARRDADPFNSIIVKSNYVEIGTQLPLDHYIYGLGERSGPFRKKPGRMALNARDTPAYEKNTYGAHPFYLELRLDGTVHGVLMRNCHPMEIELTEDSLTYHMLGGTIDLYFFAGPTADQVIEQYTRIVGRPPLYEPKFFGFHQCRFGYKTLQDWKTVVKGFEASKLPLDGIWFDIE